LDVGRDEGHLLRNRRHANLIDDGEVGFEKWAQLVISSAVEGHEYDVDLIVEERKQYVFHFLLHFASIRLILFPHVLAESVTGLQPLDSGVLEINVLGRAPEIVNPFTESCVTAPIGEFVRDLAALHPVVHHFVKTYA
ncbi:hypothetical protein KCU70_g91, partial [Aureobasidium melanogenum]